MDKYPTISLTELQKFKTILENAKSDPKYLDGRIAPYDKPVREMLKSMVSNPVVAATVEDGPKRQKAGAKSKKAIISMTELEQEFNDLRTEINTLKTDAKGLEPHERIQVVKTRAALIEKILAMKEKIGNINKVDKFMTTVMQILEDHCNQDQRLIIIDLLEEYSEKED